jgi:putative ABC transport system permease protein
MKALDILRTAIGNSFRSRLRTTLTVIAIFIGAFTLTITNGLGTGINNYIDTQVSAVGAPDVMTVTKPTETATTSDGPQKYDPGAASTISSGTGQPGATVVALTDDDITAIGAIDGITAVEPIVRVSPDYVSWGDNDKFVLSLSALGGRVAVDLAAGSGFTSDSTTAEIILPTDYIEPMGFADYESAISQQVTIGITDALREQHTVTATIVGVQEPTLFGTTATLNDTLTTELFDAQSTGLPASSTEEFASAVAHFDPASTDQEVSTIKRDLTAAGYSGTTVADQIGTFQTVIDGIILVLNAFAVIALLAAGFGIVNTLLMSVQERTREIGLMKAMGMSGSRIFALFSTEAVFIGFLGSAIGSAVGIALGSVISSVLATGFLSGLVGLQLIAFTPISIISVILLVMAIALVAAVLPAAKAARQSPIDSLRYE